MTPNPDLKEAFGNPDEVLERGVDILLSLVDAKGASPYYAAKKLAEV